MLVHSGWSTVFRDIVILLLLCLLAAVTYYSVPSIDCAWVSVLISIIVPCILGYAVFAGVAIRKVR